VRAAVTVKSELPASPGRRSWAGGVSLKGLAAVIVWGGSFAATRVALRSFDPFGLVALRMLTGTLLLAVAVRMRGRRILPLRPDLPVCIFLGIVLAGHLLIQSYGLRQTTAIHTGWIIGFIPVMIAVGAWLLGQERLSGLGWLGVALGTVGVLAVTGARLPQFAEARAGDLLQVTSCLTWTVYTLAAAGPMTRSGVLCVTTFAMGVAAVLTALATVFTGVLVGPLTTGAVLQLVYLGPLCSGVAYYLWFAAVDEQGPARTGGLIYVEPFIALFTGALLLGEPVTGWALLGGLCVLVGVWLVARGGRRV
jgi:drug/metabolite transporter (DMT)-like permease